MNKKIKKLWCAALRSCEYIQGTGFLFREDKYCFLGVLCDLYAKEKGIKWVLEAHPLSEGEKSICGECEILPYEVMEWAELESRNPKIDEYNMTLSVINDEGELSFERIADLIETNL